MSHFTRIRTRLVDAQLLKLALKDMGFTFKDGNVKVGGFAFRREAVDIVAASGKGGYDIGLRKVGDSYEVVADWWGVRGITQQQFLQRLTQRYAYHSTMVKLKEQGFTVASEEVQDNGRIHLVLRRMA